jgi:hypothetical protein
VSRKNGCPRSRRSHAGVRHGTLPSARAPPARGCVAGAKGAGLLARGSRARLPGAEDAFLESPVAWYGGVLRLSRPVRQGSPAGPLTVAGPRRIHTGFRKARFALCGRQGSGSAGAGQGRGDVGAELLDPLVCGAPWRTSRFRSCEPPRPSSRAAASAASDERAAGGRSHVSSANWMVSSPGIPAIRRLFVARVPRPVPRSPLLLPVRGGVHAPEPPFRAPAAPGSTAARVHAAPLRARA